MKTYSNLKRLAVVSSFALLVSTCPMFAQNDTNSSQSSAGQSSKSLDSYGAQTTGRSNYSGTAMNEPAGADNTGAANWSWFGLLGLLGLFGLKRPQDVRNVRT